MKLLEYKQFNNSDEEKTLNKKKVTITAIVLAIILFIILISIIYISNSGFRNFMDKYILFKSVKESDLASISIESDRDVYTYAYYNYVVVLKNNKLTLYNTSGNEVESYDININSPIFAAQDNYLVIAEKNQQKAVLLKDKKIQWEKNVEGQISRVNVNENGYVSIVVSGTSYKSVISTYSEDGSEIFKTFLSNTLVIDVDISKDNKYLSFCEMDISGTLMESKIKTISIEKAKDDPANSIIYTYNIPSNELVTNLEYHEKDILLCMCDTKLYSLKEGNIDIIADFEQEKNLAFCGVKLSKSYFKLRENTQGINNQNSDLEIYNTTNKRTYLYCINGIAKNVYSKDGVIAVNLGNEVYFINEIGWLIKKYSSTQEVRDIVISNNIAGIIYRNKIEFLGL